MPRIRTIKPEFFGDEKLAPMTPVDRLVFLGLISFADDAGRLVDNEKSIDGFIFPETSDSARESLDRLANAGRIVRYDSDSGQRLIQIANWKRHQKIDHPSKYVLPGPPRKVSRDPREGLGETVAKSSRSDLGPVPVPVPTTSTNDQRPKTEDRREPTAPPSDPAPTDFREKLLQRLPSDIDQHALRQLTEKVPNADTWCAEMLACLDGLGGHVQLTATQIGIAIRDYLGNGDDTSPSLRHFRGYLAQARKTSGNGKAAPSTIDRARLILAIANTHGLTSYIGNPDDYRRRQAEAADDPRAFPGFLETIKPLDLAHGIGNQPEPFALKELVRRIESAPTNGVHA